MPNALESALAALPETEVPNPLAKGNPSGTGGVGAMLNAVANGESLIPDPSEPAPEPPSQPAAAQPTQPAAAQPAAPAETPTETTTEEDDGGRAWLEEMLAEHAPRLGGKYSSPEEFLKGMDNLYSKIGEKGQYEDIGRLAVTDPRAALEIIQQYLPPDSKAPEAAAPAQPETAAPTEDPVLADYDYLMKRRPEFKREWVTDPRYRDREGELLPHVADKVAPYERWKREFDLLKAENPDIDEKLAERKLAKLIPKTAPAPDNAEVERLKAEQQQVQQHLAVQQFNNVLAAIINQEHVAQPDDQKWMFPPGTQQHEFGKQKLTQAGQIFWADLERRAIQAQQRGYQLDWNEAVTDAKNRAKATLRQQAAQTKTPPPKPSTARNGATHPGEPAGSVHSPAKPGVRDFPAGKSLEEALREAVRNDPGARKKLGIN
ncbi:MAG: hypothetical protein KGL39_28090 [Patescibacteria group bacterium]|nr:hypothetical protein [Patescibacteria group bacterium]